MLNYAPNSFIGINYNSPTVQNIMKKNGDYNPQMPFSTSPPIGNIGGYGYNNQYQNNSQNSMTNGEYNNYGNNQYNQYQNNPYLQYANNPQNNMMNWGYNNYGNNQYQQCQYMNYPQNNMMVGGYYPNYNNYGNNQYVQSANNIPQNYNNMMNGGYYSGYYNYDPMELRKRYEEQLKEQERILQNNINIQVLKNKLYNTYYGIETDEEYLREYYNPNTYSEIAKDIQDFEEVRRLSDFSNDPMYQLGGPNYTAINNMAKLSQEIRSKHPVDQSFVDYMNTAGDLYREALIHENIRELKKNIRNTYDRQAFHQLANMHRSSFASLRQNVSVDDLSISLPAHLRGDKEYQERKNQFLSYITRNDIRNRGKVHG